ncbi:MAG: hypothetical protein JSU70_07915, partial [Phycisphaerales bacterium]
RSTKVEPKVQAWYAFWYAWFGSHDMFSLHHGHKFHQVSGGLQIHGKSIKMRIAQRASSVHFAIPRWSYRRLTRAA